MSQLDRRFQIAYDQTRAAWAAADHARAAALAGCPLAAGGVQVAYFGRLHLVPYPEGEVVNLKVALDSYFESMGWDQETGLPTREKLDSLGLAWLK